MQASPPDSGWNFENGFLQNLFDRIKNRQKPVFWLVLFVFILFLGIGYGLGVHLVVDNPSVEASYSTNTTDTRVITLLEVSDLLNPEPELISIWFIHLTPGDAPRLGFTPVSAVSLVDEPNFDLLAEFFLDANGTPSNKFLQSLRKLKVQSDGYVILDQVAVSAFINWFSVKDSAELIGLENHSMAEYGKILRGMCQAFPGITGIEMQELPWSKISADHFKTSLHFDQVMSDIRFLTASNSPRCEMVPLP